jgi:hypothetical protein
MSAITEFCILKREVGNRRSQWLRGLWPLAFWDCGFESCQEHVILFVVIVVRCLVEVSASGWSLVQRSATECDVSGRGLCVGLVTRPEESYRVWCVR